MGKDETSSQLTQIIETLNTLSDLRVKENRWTDDERESEEESCVYKNMEILYPFFLVNYIYPTNYARITLPVNILIDDLSDIIAKLFSLQ